MALSYEFIAVGKLKQSSHFHAAFQEYLRRITSKISVIEIEGYNQSEEITKILSKIDSAAAVVVLDETGKLITSTELAKKIDEFQQIKSGKVQFIIGGADGLNDEIRQRADLVLSFGRLTWPHMMVRVMLAEQVYRAQQILANHPYHRE
jgi:23S rRNA (pseudouridine1915-N3)-methyltransferase